MPRGCRQRVSRTDRAHNEIPKYVHVRVQTQSLQSWSSMMKCNVLWATVKTKRSYYPPGRTRPNRNDINDRCRKQPLEVAASMIGSVTVDWRRWIHSAVFRHGPIGPIKVHHTWNIVSVELTAPNGVGTERISTSTGPVASRPLCEDCSAACGTDAGWIGQRVCVSAWGLITCVIKLVARACHLQMYTIYDAVFHLSNDDVLSARVMSSYIRSTKGCITDADTQMWPEYMYASLD